ncbi:MAG: 16S rRNA (cytosine(1402)-N(4))-methyltransferase RsmH [Patescibacteria group bacterium]|nr:16S rRNA (cytosine(1402)-N(4))-methyltransferase RsmH [Patescibacteria group bacterium]
MERVHQTVLLEEVLDLLRVQPGGCYIDATVGQGGHSWGIIRRGGTVLGIETDPVTVNWLKKYLAELNDKRTLQNFKLVRGNFANLSSLAAENGFGRVAGIIFDLGLSSFELSYSGRGFSYQTDEPLDMRFDPDNGGSTAADLLNELNEEELYEIFTKFGEERDARRLAQALVRLRLVERFKTTRELRDFVETASQPNPARLSRIFQALRIAVNDELSNLKKGLLSAVDLLEPGGRVAVIAFHSLEDRLVKEQFRFWSGQKRGQVITRTPVRPSREELFGNRRCRSAKLRVFEVF